MPLSWVPVSRKVPAPTAEIFWTVGAQRPAAHRSGVNPKRVGVVAEHDLPGRQDQHIHLERVFVAVVDPRGGRVEIGAGDRIELVEVDRIVEIDVVHILNGHLGRGRDQNVAIGEHGPRPIAHAELGRDAIDHDRGHGGSLGPTVGGGGVVTGHAIRAHQIDGPAVGQQEARSQFVPLGTDAVG